MPKLYVKLNTTSWKHGDFSSESKITGTVYTDREMVNPKDLTDFAVHIRLFRRYHRHDFFNRQATITSPATSGSFEYAVRSGDMPFPQLYLLEIELSKDGVVESTEPIEFLVKHSPPSSNSSATSGGTSFLLLEDGGNLVLE